MRGTVSQPLFNAIIVIGIAAFVFDVVILIKILINNYKSNWRVLVIIILSAFSSLIAIVFSFPGRYQSYLSLNTLCHTQAVSMELIYVFQSIALLLLLQFYDFGLITNMCSFHQINQHRTVPSHSIGSSEELVQMLNNNNHCSKYKMISLLSTAIICFTTCIITVFGYGYSIRPISDVTNDGIIWYGCYCENQYACYLLWGLPHALLEIYFIATSIMTYTKVVESANIYQAQIIFYIVIRFLVIVCLLPIAMANINTQEMANYYAGYMSFTLIFISMLSIITMVIPRIYTGKHAKVARRKDDIYSPDSYQDDNDDELQITIDETKKTAPLKPATKQIESMLTAYSTTEMHAQRLSPRDALNRKSTTNVIHPLRTSTTQFHQQPTLLSLTRPSLPDSSFANSSITEQKGVELTANESSQSKSNTKSNAKSKSKSSSTKESFEHSHTSNTDNAVGEVDVETKALEPVKETNDEISVNID